MVLADTSPGLLSARDAVIRDTPASRATSCSVTDLLGEESDMRIWKRVSAVRVND